MTPNFPSEICCSFSYNSLYYNVRFMSVFGLWSLVYYSNFQVRKITAINQHISGNDKRFSINLAVAWVKFSKNRQDQFFYFQIFLRRASKQKETYFVTRKVLQEFEGHAHWHCKHIHFELFKYLQNGRSNRMCEIWVDGAKPVLFGKIVKKTKIAIRPGFPIFAVYTI